VQSKLVDVVNADIGASADIAGSKLADNGVTLAKLEDGTQGDILYYGASGAPARLGFGTTGDFLKTQGTGANPVWATSPAGGKLLQMVVDSYTAEQSTTATVMGTMPNLSTTITLANSANTVLVWVALNGITRDSDDSAGSAATSGVFELFRDTTKVADLGGYVAWFEPTDGTQLGLGSFGCSFPDTPGDTSAHAYTLKWARSRDDGASYIYMNRGGSTYSSIICLEIAA